MSCLANRLFPLSTPAGARTVVLASCDASFRQRVKDTLLGLRWQVREARGGAEAFAQLEAKRSDALILDAWLPDLEIREFVREFEQRYPGVELVWMDSRAEIDSSESAQAAGFSRWPISAGPAAQAKEDGRQEANSEPLRHA